MYLWIQLKFKGYLVHYQKQTTISESKGFEPITGRIANLKVD